MKKNLLLSLAMLSFGAFAQLPSDPFAQYEFTGGSINNTAPTSAANLTGSITTVGDRNGNPYDAAKISTGLTGVNTGSVNVMNATLSFWMKSDPVNSDSRIIQLYGTDGAGFRVNMDGSKIRFSATVRSGVVPSVTIKESPIEIDDNTWHHVAFRAESTNSGQAIKVTLFVDGTIATIDGQNDYTLNSVGTIDNF